MSLFESLDIISLIASPIWPLLFAESFLLVINPFACVRGSIQMDINPLSVRFFIDPITFIHSSITMNHSSESVRQVIVPRPLVVGSICPQLPSISLLNTPTPLPTINNVRISLNRRFDSAILQWLDSQGRQLFISLQNLGISELWRLQLSKINIKLREFACRACLAIPHSNFNECYQQQINPQPIKCPEYYQPRIILKLMRPFPTICLILLLSLSSSRLTNKEAQKCFQKAVNSQTCSASLSSCYQNKECEAEINSFPCDFMDNDYLFNGYCFNHWYQKSVLSKELITCLVNECDLRFNSKHNMTEFFECNSEVVQGMKDMVCDQECYDDLTVVMNCMQQHPVEYCYSQQKQNADANKIVTAIRQTCLQHKEKAAEVVSDEL